MHVKPGAGVLEPGRWVMERLTHGVLGHRVPWWGSLPGTTSGRGTRGTVAPAHLKEEAHAQHPLLPI